MPLDRLIRVIGVLVSVGIAACSGESNGSANDPLDRNGAGQGGSDPVGGAGQGGSDPVGGAGSGGGQSGSSATAFFNLLNFTNTSETELSRDMLIEQADAIVQGSFVAVEDGRTVDFAEGASNALHMAVFKFSISKVLKGPVSQFAYVEHIRGGVPVDSFRKFLPVQVPVILFLREATGWDPPVYVIDGDGKGRPEGTTLYTYLTERGLVAEDTELYCPLADSPCEAVFGEAVTTLDALADVIAAAVD